MSEEQQRNLGEAEEDVTGKTAKLGRREMLAALGAVGTAIATGAAATALA